MRYVLIVDDELCMPANSEAFSKEFPVEDVEFLFAGNDDELDFALEENDKISLILLDIRFEAIGETHGINILKRLVDDGLSIPIVMMSSLSDVQTVINAWDMGAHGYIVKWSSNSCFHQDLKKTVAKYARTGPPVSSELVDRRRCKIIARTKSISQGFSDTSLGRIIEQALEFKRDVHGTWVNSIPFRLHS
jgi:DNA-binding NarL/FixJ family response regulator